MVTITLCIIAICEVVRAVQNAIQIRAIHGDVSARENVYSEFVNSLKSTDKEFVKRMLREFDEDKGKWIKGDVYTCNKCGYKMIVGGGSYNFCPNCGKPMENDGDDL